MTRIGVSLLVLAWASASAGRMAFAAEAQNHDPDDNVMNHRRTQDNQPLSPFIVEFLVKLDLWPIDMTFTIFQHTGSTVFEDTPGTPFFSGAAVYPNGTVIDRQAEYTWQISLDAPAHYALQIYDTYGDGLNSTTDSLFQMSRPGQGTAPFIDSNDARFNPPGTHYGFQTNKMWFYIGPRGAVILVDPEPRELPTPSPTEVAPPTKNPTSNPTKNPTVRPSSTPTDIPTASPSSGPVTDPTSQPTDTPTTSPTTKQCSICFLLSPLTFDQSQTLAQDAGCNLASIERTEERAIVATEIADFLLLDKLWIGGTKYPPTSNCVEPRLLQQQQQQPVCPNPIAGETIPVIVQATTASSTVSRNAESLQAPLISFYPVVAAGVRPVPVVAVVPSPLPLFGQSKEFRFELDESFACGIDRIELKTNPGDRGNLDSWLVEDLKLTFDGEVYSLDLNKVGRPGIWLDGQPFDSPPDVLYGRYPYSDHWTLDCDDCTGSTGQSPWVWVDGTPFSENLWAPGQPNNSSEVGSAKGPIGYAAVGRDQQSGEAVLYDEAMGVALPSVWECCNSDCPEAI